MFSKAPGWAPEAVHVVTRLSLMTASKVTFDAPPELPLTIADKKGRERHTFFANEEHSERSEVALGTKNTYGARGGDAHKGGDSGALLSPLQQTQIYNINSRTLYYLNNELRKLFVVGCWGWLKFVRFRVVETAFVGVRNIFRGRGEGT